MITQFWDTLETFGETPALCNKNSIVQSYSDLAKDVEDFSQSLGQNKRLVQIFMDNSQATITAYLGALKGGHAILIQDKENLALAEILNTTYTPDTTFNPETGLTFVSDPDPHLHSDLALLMSTSGTTGSNKTVRLSFENLASNALAIGKYLAISPEEKALLTLPLHYCYGLSVLNSHLAKGGSVIVGLNSVADQHFSSLLQDSKATSFAGVPFSFELMERTGFRHLDFPHLRYITQAGGRLSEDLVIKYHRWAEEKRKKFYVMYGQTEATSRIAYLSPDLVAQHPNCIGKPIPGGAIEIRDEEGKAITEADKPGELVYYGPNVMSGYAEEKKDLALGNEVVALYTGDIGCRNSAGLFYLVGRKKRIAKLYGIRLNLDQVENWLHQNGYATTCCVSDDKSLFVVSPQQVDQEEMARLINKQYNLSPKDVKTVLLEELPLMSSGKINYQAVLTFSQQNEVVHNQHDNPAQTEKTEQAILKSLTVSYEKNLSLNNIPVEESFISLGGDSLSYLAISLDIEKSLGTLPRNWETIPINKLAEYKIQRTSTFWSEIEVSALLRVIAPLAIVMNHSGLNFLAGGAALLLIVSGFNFNRFSRNDMLSLHFGHILKLFFQNILIPYWLILVTYQAYKGEFSFLEISLINNLIGEQAIAPFNTWFIQALFQSVLLTLLFFIPGVIRQIGKNHFFWAGMLLLSIGLASRLLDEYLLSELLNNKGKQITWVFWLFALGLTCSACKNVLQRILLTMLAITAPFLCYADDYPRILFITIGGLLLIWLQRINVPVFLVKPIGIIGSSSLFIYMTHQLAPISSYTATWPIDIIRIIFGVVLGIASWYFYHLALKCVAVLNRFIFRKKEVEEKS